MKCFIFLKYFLLIKAKMILKTKLQKNMVVSIIINNLKVLDKLGSFSNPIFKAINNITTKAKAEIVVEDRIAFCAVSGNKASQVKEGMILELEGNEYEVETVKIDTYGQAVASAEVSVADGTYEGTIVIERVTPISFLFH